MKRNVTGQVVGCEMVTASDGSAFTGAVTCYVTGDNGTQAVGAAGAGACTHKGNGYHTYAPTQAETNYAQIAFTFLGTGAVPQTQEVNTVDEVWGIQTAALTLAGSVGQRLAPIRYFTAAAGSTTQVTLDTGAPATAQLFHNAMVYCVGGAGVGQSAVIDTYSTGRVGVFYEPVAVAFDSTSQMHLLPGASAGAAAPTVAQITAGVWAVLTSGLTLTGSIGKYLLDTLTAIKGKTDSLTFTVANKSDTNLTAINGDAAAAANLARAASAIYVGTVTGTPTQTSFVDSGLPGSVDGHWNGSVCIMLGTALKGAKSTVLASGASAHTITLKSDEPLPAAPTVNDLYILV